MAERGPSRILLLEDEKNVGSTLFERLQKEGFDASWARSVSEAFLEISERKFDLMLLDIGLPDGSGLEVARKARKEQPQSAIIFLTAHGSPEDRIQGLELGAEDYVVKPFHLKELLLRIQNGLKRARYLSIAAKESANAEILVLGKAKIDFGRFQAESDGEIHALTHKEAAMLQLLVARRQKVVSRDEILNHVWSEDEFPTSRTVDNFIMRLRRLIEVDPESPQVIKSIRGVGYQLL